jgi:hypothetical protein
MGCALEVRFALDSLVEEAGFELKGREGDVARQYLFQREYDMLPSDNKARLLLAALALFARPAKFGELQTVLNFSPEQVKDCISSTIEMFL